MKNHLFPVIKISCLLLFCISCTTKTPTPKDLSQENLIPKPVSLIATGSSFEINDKTSIIIANKELLALGEYFADLLRPATGFALPIVDSNTDNGISLALVSDQERLGDEGYQLIIEEDQVNLIAQTSAGLFMGLQTIRQLLPVEVENETLQQTPWEIATGSITDYPNYGYRGAMLDVSRHFFAVEDVKRYIDFLAMYKMNTLHLHLSDDQGWRIEIKSWPNLTTHGGSTEVGGGKGGFYTQQQYKEIVNYATDRFITIIPEIDMPGHTNAALASYAELNCDNIARELYMGTEVGFSTFCIDKEITYQFIDDVVGELSALTPGPYIHIGGDESHVTAKEDYIPFIERVQDIVNAHGKQMIGWDETAQSGLKSNSVVQLWYGVEHAKAGIAKGAKLIMSPAHKTYMDMQYDSMTRLGLHWAGYIEIDSAYTWDPANLIEGINKENIMGIEAPLWTETIENMEDIEYMVFPRLPGYAEIGWTSVEVRNWDEYKERLAAQAKRFEVMDINYYRSKLVWEN